MKGRVQHGKTGLALMASLEAKICNLKFAPGTLKLAAN